MVSVVREASVVTMSYSLLVAVVRGCDVLSQCFKGLGVVGVNVSKLSTNLRYNSL